MILHRRVAKKLLAYELVAHIGRAAVDRQGGNDGYELHTKRFHSCVGGRTYVALFS